jgi:NADH:ubiquinone oxidoreductase subunit F (NADH-binding)
MDILSKIRQANLLGRGGAGYPVAKKWEAVMSAPGQRKFVVCNASEGEPGVKKDGFLLEKFPEKIFLGMHIAAEFLHAEKSILYLNPSLYKKLYVGLKKIAWDYSVEIFLKPESAGYIGGEETSILNALEKRRIEPRLRPPFPTISGLWNAPTLINNAETFYAVSLIDSGDYHATRFYTISGDTIYPGVYEFPEDYTIRRILEETHNWPNFNFFAQIGGSASGEVLHSRQLERKAAGTGSITIYSQHKHLPLDIIKKWLDFFKAQSCGKCTPCREGTLRLREILDQKEIDWKIFRNLLDTLADTAFCGLGSSVPLPIISFIINVLPDYENATIGLTEEAKRDIHKNFLSVV